MDPTTFGAYEPESNDDDKKLFVSFFRGSIINDAKSLEAGRQVSDDVDMVRIQAPGQRDYVVHRVDDGHKFRFPRQWAQYQANAEQLGSGTQLSDVTWLSPGQISDLRAANIRTVEQLAAVPDSQGHTLMGFHGLKQRAQVFLEQAAGNAPLIKMVAELEKRDTEIAELRAIVDRLVAEKRAEATGKKAPAKTADLT